VAHPSSREENELFSTGVKLATHLQLVPSFFMTWCLIKHIIMYRFLLPVCFNVMLKLVVYVVTIVF
jgi:hypothetical protein